MWKFGRAQPVLQGGQRFFFIITAMKWGLFAWAVLTRRHWPQPPPPSLSEPQKLASGPMESETWSEAAPVIQSFSPYKAPPKSLGSAGAYWTGETYLLLSQGLRKAASQPWPLQSQKCVAAKPCFQPCERSSLVFGLSSEASCVGLRAMITWQDHLSPGHFVLQYASPGFFMKHLRLGLLQQPRWMQSSSSSAQSGLLPLMTLHCQGVWKAGGSSWWTPFWQLVRHAAHL
mmetsp:Transcript_6993/g.20614  ORF Transcript_6993/g.20614 Transcript_6993/m.20614 type:complete len:230 (-) Transcript_6993:179-868(-)